MKHLYKLALAVTLTTSVFTTAKAQCPTFKGVLVDACNGAGTEGDNEFMLLRNGGTAMTPSALNIYYSPTLTGGVPSGTANNSTVHFGGTGFNNTYSSAELTIIDNLNAANVCVPAANIFARPATSATPISIPANAYVVVMQPSLTSTYDWTGFCSQAQTQPIWILFEHNNNGNGSGSTYANGFNTGGGGRFKNYGTSSANNDRYFSMTSGAYPGCTEASSVRSYDYTNLPANSGSRDGGAVAWAADGTASYSNSGCSAPIILPLHLLHFSGARQDGSTRLSWLVTCENTMQEHIIEGAADDGGFHTIAHVAARNQGCGEETSYTYTDNGADGSNFYRLKMVEQSGKISYSNTVRLGTGNNASNVLAVSPNPATDHLQVRGLSSGDAYRVTDVAGRPVLAGVVSEAGEDITVQSLPAGMYYLRTGDGRAVRFLKQ